MSAIAMTHIHAVETEPSPWLQWFVRIPDARASSAPPAARRQESAHQPSAEELGNGDPPPQILWGEDA